MKPKQSDLHFTPDDLDALREICAVGTGHASTALSELTGQAISVSFPTVDHYPIENIPALIGHPTELVSTVHLEIQGKQKTKTISVGSFLLIFPLGEAKEFSGLIQHKNVKELRDIDNDALRETGNILSGACLEVLSEFLNFRLIESLPESSVDMLNASLDSLLAGIAYEADESLVFKTDFRIQGKKIQSYFILLFNPSVYSLLLKKLREAQNV